MNPEATFRLTIVPPMRSSANPIAVEFRMDEFTFRESFAELPRDREILPDSAMRAVRQRRMRQEIADDLAQRLSEEILKAIEQNDPQFGYSRKEWEAMHA